MGQLVAVLFAAVSSLIIFSASYVVKDKITRDISRDYFAKEVASYWVSFGKSLQRYAENNSASLPTGNTIVTCNDLKNAGYLQSGFPCRDIFGQEARGLISKPLGALQSVIVYPATPASVDLYLKLGIKERVTQRSFLSDMAMKVKKLNPDYDLVFYKKNGTFEENFSWNADNIGDYTGNYVPPVSFPLDSNYEYAPIMFVKRAKGIGYWVWTVQETDTGIVFSNQGFSSVCPIPNGLPKKPPNGNWTFNPLPWGERNYSGFITSTVMSTYICIPATQDTVLRNPGASIPSLSVKITQSFLDVHIENKHDAEGDYIRWASADCGGRSYFGTVVISIGSRKYTVFAWQNICAGIGTASGASVGDGEIDTMLLYVEGEAPSTFCLDLAPGDLYNYCYNVDSLLSGAGGSRAYVSFVE